MEQNLKQAVLDAEDEYALLSLSGVPVDASSAAAQLQRAHRKLLLAVHPDKLPEHVELATIAQSIGLNTLIAAAYDAAKGALDAAAQNTHTRTMSDDGDSSAAVMRFGPDALWLQDYKRRVEGVKCADDLLNISEIGEDDSDDADSSAAVMRFKPDGELRIVPAPVGAGPAATEEESKKKLTLQDKYDLLRVKVKDQEQKEKKLIDAIAYMAGTFKKRLHFAEQDREYIKRLKTELSISEVERNELIQENLALRELFHEKTD